MAYLLRQANSVVREVLEQALSSTELTQPQFVTLTITNAYESLSGAEIARIALLTPQTVTVITRNLVRDGLLARTPDPNNAKIVRFTLTQSGQSILKRAQSKASAVEQIFTEGLSPERETFIRTWLVEVAHRSPSRPRSESD
jgi:DNA-binding MarR family transcriptional regulator